MPGVQEPAATLLAELGPEPAQFGSEKKLSSWAGVAGNTTSAGRNQGSPTHPGNRWLKAA